MRSSPGSSWTGRLCGIGKLELPVAQGMERLFLMKR